MKYVVQKVQASSLTGARYVAEEFPIDAATDEEAKAAMPGITATCDGWVQAVLVKQTGEVDGAAVMETVCVVEA